MWDATKAAIEDAGGALSEWERDGFHLSALARSVGHYFSGILVSAPPIVVGAMLEVGPWGMFAALLVGGVGARFLFIAAADRADLAMAARVRTLAERNAATQLERARLPALSGTTTAAIPTARR
jgi:hypothetical protein